MRILAIDPGERRIGLAVSDELGITAQGLETFDRRTGGDFLIFVEGLIGRMGVVEIVIGHPLHMSGDRSASSERSEKLASDLRARTGIEVTLWDERLSSKEAERVLRGTRAGKGAVDRIAAVLILQSYLDKKGSGN